MRWPRTFGGERVEAIERLSRLTGHSEEVLCRALRGIPLENVSAIATFVGHPPTRDYLDRRVKEVQTRD